jgi:multicomponent Na+:H+ antiporter subunit F
MMMFAAAAVAVLVAMGLALVRAFTGPTVFDRILAVNTTGTLTVVLIAVYGFLENRPDFLDISLLYALINFIGTVAVTKYVKFGATGVAPDKRDQGDI